MLLALLIIAGLTLTVVLVLLYLFIGAGAGEVQETHAVGFHYTPPQEEDEDVC